MKKYFLLISTVYLFLTTNCYSVPLAINCIHGYDNASRVTNLTYNLPPITYDYIYNDVGNRTSMTAPEGTHSYTYDAIDQLTTYNLPPTTTNYTYGRLGNRTATGNIYNSANRLTEDAQYRYTYDNNGNLITKENKTTRAITTYTYNAENQLITINYPLSTINYFYDGLGRRIEKNTGGEITRYIYDGMDVLAEFNGANELIRSYVHGPSIDEPLELRTGPTTYYYISDGLGNITALVDGAGNIVEEYRYDAFGNTTILNAAGEEISESAVGNRYMFTAREYDAETGLYYYRLRYYDPLVGRFLQEDPVGYYNSLNLYEYCWNNPVNWTDPFGLEAWRKKRPLDFPTQRDTTSGRRHHDQIFYDHPRGPDKLTDHGFNKDPHRGGPGGFFTRHDGRFGPDIAPQELQNRYEIVSGPYDEATLWEAEQNVTRWWGDDYNLLWHNCQDYCDAVIEEYNRLMLERLDKPDYK